MQNIAEETDKELCNSWFEKARNVKLEELQDFIATLINSYNHDYGTICYAMAAAGLAALYASNKEPGAGITGFQASIIDLEILKRWRHIDGPFKVINFEYMLYPQYSYYFNSSLSEETWKWLQRQACTKIQEYSNADCRSPPSEVFEHWKSIADGKIPFGWSVEKANRNDAVHT